MIYVWVAFAGGAGALLRFGVSRVVMTQGWFGFPYATLFVNVLGSFLIGYLAWTLTQKWGLSEEAKFVVVSGFLGGFTTFSAFSLEVVGMFEQGAVLKAIAYMSLTLVLCVSVCAVGVMMAKAPS